MASLKESNARILGIVVQFSENGHLNRWVCNCAPRTHSGGVQLLLKERKLFFGYRYAKDDPQRFFYVAEQFVQEKGKL